VDSTSYRDNFIASLRNEIVDTVARELSPIANHYGFTDVPLETNIRWRPMVLIIGNYSSGKSSLINEFLGGEIQATGQAPTDDSFTVITYDDSVPESEGIRVTEECDGQSLINDPTYPFTTLRKQGQRFASHFLLKKVNSPFLRDLSIVDTPGMLDSITERDRGYDYHEIVGDLAQKADLILVLFDAHKAGTIREAYKSIRETLNVSSFEDRILFVLNRIDECASLDDMLRVYGSLCWNLSQITGRKDIPPIHLTYSPSAARHANQEEGYLPLLKNQRDQLRQAILRAPRRRLHNLASFVETQGARLSHYLEALAAFREGFRDVRTRSMMTGMIIGVLGGSVAVAAMVAIGLLVPPLLLAVGGGTGCLLLLLWLLVFQRKAENRFQEARLENIDELTPLEDQTRRDNWEAVRDRVLRHLKKGDGRYSLYEVQRDHAMVSRICSDVSQDIREALSELANMHEDTELEVKMPRLERAREEAIREEEMRIELLQRYGV
jgi:EH domain-containing protein 1